MGTKPKGTEGGQRRTAAGLERTLREISAERDEALEQQTATAEILEIISRSAGDPTPVFEAILERAMRVCDAPFGGLLVPDGDCVRYVAFSRRTPKPFADFLTRERIGLKTMLGADVLKGTVLHVADLSQEEGYRRRVPVAVSAVEDGGIRTLIMVPMMRDRGLVGVFTLYRQEVRPFTEREVAMAQSFAAQAAIAMENARLITETREALERQTATAEVLQVINSSPNDLNPVFDAILAKAHVLCGAVKGSLVLYDGETFSGGAIHHASESFRKLVLSPAHRASGSPPGRLLAGENLVHIPDARQVDDPMLRAAAEHDGARTVLYIPLRQEGKLLGYITAARQEVQPFSEKQVALLQSFADQAVIAIENARLLSELRERTHDLEESLEYQTATADVLKVISRSTFDLQRVLDTLVQTAGQLCNATGGGLTVRDGDVFRYRAFYALSDELTAILRQRPVVPARDTVAGRTALEGKVVRLSDLSADPSYGWSQVAESREVRSIIGVPMLREGTVVGTFSLVRNRVEPFTDRQVELVRTFADQAVIAIENARLLSELRERTHDLEESLEYQTATSDVLKVISRSTFDLQPVLDTVCETAARLCNANGVGMTMRDGDVQRYAASYSLDEEFVSVLRQRTFSRDRSTIVGRTVLEGRVVHIPDVAADPDYALSKAITLGQTRTLLGVPLLRDGDAIGTLVLHREHMEPFTQRQVELVRTFADQAVIAIENTRLLTELDKRRSELRVTFDNMGDGVAMFDGERRLAAWNRNLVQILDIDPDWLAAGRTYADLIEYLSARGEFGASPPPDVDAPAKGTVRSIRYERIRPDGRVLEVRRNPVPGGGFVIIYSDITEHKRAEAEIGAARDAAEKALADLKAAQANLIQAEKMASLGQLTAGIAHEIKNPLNFVNNFAGLSVELLEELKETTTPAIAALDEERRGQVDEVVEMLTGNLNKIAEHGKRADGIVKSMLAHSRGSSGDRREADINALVEESLNLAYHGARAQDQNFNITLERDYDESVAPVTMAPQDMTRVFLNLCGNGFYAANKRKDQAGDDFRPTLKVTTRELGDAVEVRIHDNGTGMSREVRDRLFQPFFTTKPTGEGTGLGLSISYDIVTQQHGGTIAVESEVGDFTEFIIRLPRKR